MHLSGLPAFSRQRARSPGRRFAPPREEHGAVLLYQNQISVCTPKFQLPPAVKPLLPKSSLIA